MRTRGLELAVVVLAACGDGGGGPADAPPVVDGAPDASREGLLSGTGLYADFAARTLADGVAPFAPTYALWSDGAVKSRWIALPDGAAIDATDLDRWIPPVGTRVWKQFASPEGVVIETRLIERRGDDGGDDDWWFGSFVWRDDDSDAELAPDGAADVRGTHFDVPSQTDCLKCHRGQPGRLLGFTAVQLAGAGDGLRLDALVDGGSVVPAPAAAVLGFPGDAVTAAAIGTLHASCGHCHNDHGIAWPDTRMDLNVRSDAASAETSAVWTTTVGVGLESFVGHGPTVRIAPGDPDASAIVVRMASRVQGTAMPPLFSEIVDDAGVARVRAWIETL